MELDRVIKKSPPVSTTKPAAKLAAREEVRQRSDRDCSRHRPKMKIKHQVAIFRAMTIFQIWLSVSSELRPFCFLVSNRCFIFDPTFREEIALNLLQAAHAKVFHFKVIIDSIF
jgi:hypothetical protein